jgi:hypothetical protein
MNTKITKSKKPIFWRDDGRGQRAGQDGLYCANKAQRQIWFSTNTDDMKFLLVPKKIRFMIPFFLVTMVFVKSKAWFNPQQKILPSATFVLPRQPTKTVCTDGDSAAVSEHHHIIPPPARCECKTSGSLS